MKRKLRYPKYTLIEKFKSITIFQLSLFHISFRFQDNKGWFDFDCMDMTEIRIFIFVGQQKLSDLIWEQREYWLEIAFYQNINNLFCCKNATKHCIYRFIAFNISNAEAKFKDFYFDNNLHFPVVIINIVMVTSTSACVWESLCEHQISSPHGKLR